MANDKQNTEKSTTSDKQVAMDVTTGNSDTQNDHQQQQHNVADNCVEATETPAPVKTDPIKTAILMLSMGGPESDKLEDVQKFTSALFDDRDIIQIPMQGFLGPLLSKRGAPSLKAKYDEIGGDPLRDWTERQGRAIALLLDKISPETKPHKAYTCFRYTRPDIGQAVAQLEADEAENVVLLANYPQFSCSTTGSNLNEIARYCIEVKKHLELTSSEKEKEEKEEKREDEKEKASSGGPKQRWSLIDRWPISEAIVDSYADLIELEVAKLPEEARKNIVLLFSAHSLPMWMIERGDDYTGEIGGSVQAIMEKLNRKYAYALVWQSKFGPGQWQGPQLDKAIEGFVSNGHKHFVVIPIAFINENVETLHELDIEYARDLKKRLNFETFARVPAANDHPKFIEGLAKLVKEHLKSKVTVSAQMRRRCQGCTKDTCKRTRAWLERLDELNRQLAD